VELSGTELVRRATPLNAPVDATRFDQDLIEVEFRPVGIPALVTERSIWLLFGAGTSRQGACS